ncbi:hypothetical protein TNIN_71701 [Trichonephila inaurata madagascariensis]|uniref:Uncharacterized protein n=1 Tax=Trichonephila inaurata madagascariensis TaxID=2747483 RepID=A0A8X6X6C4_9ARAC|nr:hypothetical protein TNIN_71701 [Trichonephila inaurata madagascariensis]
MHHAMFSLLKLLLFLVVTSFLVLQTEGFCYKPLCDAYPMLSYFCCGMNSDCCNSANLEEDNCIKVVIASD